MRWIFSFLMVSAVIGSAGCDVPVESFPPNRLYALVVETSRDVPTEVAADDTSAVVEDWFGTPNEPRWPSERLSGDVAALVNSEKLIRAAGPVYSDRENRHFGLFNEHCVTCHGVSGGGDGPASMLQNPYPRDFRSGIFKWKSTGRSDKPTRQDLMAILRHGAPGTAMPSFQRIDEEDLDALVDYVIYLSVRGEFERRLLSGSVDELGYEDTRPEKDASLRSILDADADTDAMAFAEETLDRIVSRWLEAPQMEVEVGENPAVTPESVERGRELFHGQIANCAGCHGKEGNADLVTLDFDDWTKEYTTRLSISPDDRDAVRPFRKAGAPRPRQIHPRRLSDGVYRGGSDPASLYRRLVTGIAGTPMPAVIVSAEPSATGLTASQVWDLVHYLRALGGLEE